MLSSPRTLCAMYAHEARDPREQKITRGTPRARGSSEWAKRSVPPPQVPSHIENTTGTMNVHRRASTWCIGGLKSTIRVLLQAVPARRRLLVVLHDMGLFVAKER